MNNNAIYEEVHTHIYDPSGFTLFKASKKDKAECHVYSCSNKDACSLYAKGKCCNIAVLFGRGCVYGKRNNSAGFTRNARGFHGWIENKKKQHESTFRKLKEADRRIAEIGDYIWLPYAHMDMCTAVPFVSHSSGFVSGQPFLPKSEFTIENIIKLCNFIPYALFGGSIGAYQKESVVNFIRDLSEEMPLLYAQLCEAYPRALEISGKVSHIGRKALLRSIKIGTVINKNGDWTWDGVYLTSTNFSSSFLPFNKIEETRFKPSEDAVIEITSNDLVTTDTIFV